MKKITTAHLRVLESCGSFGYLATREIAQLAWPNMSTASALSTAQTATSKLRAAGLLLQRPLEGDSLSRAYVLTSRGADLLNDHYGDDWMVLGEPTTQTWFGDGYDLATLQWLARKPLIELVHQMSAATGLRAIGQRGTSRGFLGLRQFRHFEAVLVDEQDEVVFGVYLAHGATGIASGFVRKLALGPTPFLIAAGSPSALNALARRRDISSPSMAEYLSARLPAGIIA